MCGIAGTINYNNNLDLIKTSLFHRGPDKQDIYSYNNIHLIHTRLSIQDVSHGHQPFEFKNYVIVFNGEIYNHLYLREKYLKDFIFTTNSDTETLLYLYIKFKHKMFELLDGMFAFAILDKSNNIIILSRDRAGKKPLYMYTDSNSLMFASELNAIKAGIPDLELNENEIAAYLRNGFFFKTATPYKNVLEFEPGFVYEIDIDSLHIKKEKYFDILDFYQKDKIYDFDYAKSELDNILHKSVKDRLLSSDLEVGAFLSGGIDSSLIVAVASQYVNKLKTFTVKFEGTFDESHLARLTANKYNTQHHELSISMNLKDDIEKILANYGEPFMDSSAIPSYYVSQEAKKHVTVILNGDGADEIFGGYRRYVPIANNWVKFASYFSFLSKILPKSHNKQSIYNYATRLLAMSSKSGLDFYNSATNDIFEDVYKFNKNNTCIQMNDYINTIENENITELSKILYMDFNLILQSDLLKKMDIATMAHSLEGRSPFLSKYMLEFAPRLADKFKISGATTKFLLRELSKQYLPQELISQPKRGFEVPLKNWIENDLKDNVFDALNHNSYSQKFVDKGFINNLLEKRIPVSDEKRAKILWTLYSLESWHKNGEAKINHKIEMPNKITEEKKINVLHLTTGIGLGGAERVVLDICKNIDKSNFDVSVVSLSSQNTLEEEFRKNLIDTYVLNCKKSLYDICTILLYLNKFLENKKIDIVHAHMFHTMVLLTILKIFKPRMKIIFTPHNTYISSKLRQYIVYCLKPFRKIDTIFASNMKSFFHKNNAALIPNGINYKDYDAVQSKNEVFTFVIVGRLENMKNHTYLIDIINEMKQYDFKLLIIGGGFLEVDLKNKVTTLGLDEKIEFLGPRMDVPDILERCHCLLLPSLWEAFPIVLLEAGASNIPVITTSVGSIPSFITSENGYIVQLEDFKKAMINVFKNYDRAIEKSKKLHQLVKEKYNIQTIVKQYEKLYKTLDEEDSKL